MVREMGPKWVVPWLRAPFYADRCDTHTKQYHTVFCGTCMAKPSCGVCWDSHESMHHHNHRPILHVLKASHRAAIKLSEIRKHWDVSEVQVYNFNSSEILHLNPNPNPPPKEGSGAPSSDSKCVTCKRKLKDSHYSFCSIACKHYFTHGYETHIQGAGAIERKVGGQKQPTVSFRKRSRKGVPRRAPLF